MPERNIDETLIIKLSLLGMQTEAMGTASLYLEIDDLPNASVILKDAIKTALKEALREFNLPAAQHIKSKIRDEDDEEE